MLLLALAFENIDTIKNIIVIYFVSKVLKRPSLLISKMIK